MSRKDRIYHALFTQLMPETLEVLDESFMHHVPKDAESHFKVTLVSAQFKDMLRVHRHRLVQQLLHVEFQQGLHALSIHLYTPDEWRTRQHTTRKSPNCLGGKHKDTQQK